MAVVKDTNAIKLENFTVEHPLASSLHPNEYNPNLQSDDDFYLLCMSIHEDGFTQPVVAQPDDTIVDGEHRWTAMIVLRHLEKNNLPMSKRHVAEARARRMEIIDPELTIPTVHVNMTEVQRRIATLRHNRARGQEQIDVLSGLMHELEALGAKEWAADSLDMDPEEMDRLLAMSLSVLDDFPGEEPSKAWEPQQTVPGQLQNFTTLNGSTMQHVAANARESMGDMPPSVVPGLQNSVAVQRAIAAADTPPTSALPASDLPQLVRRIYLFRKEDADIVDAVLGSDDGAGRLVALCRATQNNAAPA